MARPQRIQFPDASYHIMARGNGGDLVFRDDEDRRMFMELLGETALWANWRVHAWCLMGNHFHLFLTTRQPNLSASMQRFNSTYSQRFNRRHSRSGHVFQGRYKALLVASDAYGLALYRYILRNPLEAKLVRDPLAYAWSSASALLADRRKDWWDFSLLDQLLTQDEPEERERALRAFLSKEERAPVALQGRVYGTQEDVDILAKKTFMPDDLIRQPIAAYAKAGEKPWLSMARAVKEGKHRPASVARHYGVHTSTVTRAVTRFETQGLD